VEKGDETIASKANSPSDEQLVTGLRLALAQAKAAEELNTYPIGAIITDFEGNIIAQAHNRVIPNHDPTAHAEIEVIRKAGKHLREHKHQSVLYTTVEPCLMCMGAIITADIATVVWGVNDRYAGAAGFVLTRYEKQNLKKPTAIPEPDPETAMEIRKLMRTWEQRRGYGSDHWA